MTDDHREGPTLSVDAAIEAMAPEILSLLNTDFEDSVLLVGRTLGGRPHATACRVDRIDARGLHATITDPDGEHPAAVPFPEPVTDPTHLTPQLMALVVQARAVSGEEGTTSAERVVANFAELQTYFTEVVAVEDVHPHLRRITFGGGDLDTFAPVGPDTFLYLLLPPPGRRALTIDRSFTWEAVDRMPEAERPVGAYYTLRRWYPDRHALEMLFVLHEPAGPSSSWAAAAQPGNPVALWGPRTAFAPPDDTVRYLLIADETGLPAVAGILESLEDDVPVQVLAETADAAAHQDLPVRPSVTVTWLHRDGDPAGTTTLLTDAAAALEPLSSGTYVWGGGESRAMTGVRKIVRTEWGLPREAVSLVAYWRHSAHLGDPTDDQ